MWQDGWQSKLLKGVKWRTNPTKIQERIKGGICAHDLFRTSWFKSRLVTLTTSLMQESSKKARICLKMAMVVFKCSYCWLVLIALFKRSTTMLKSCGLCHPHSLCWLCYDVLHVISHTRLSCFSASNFENAGWSLETRLAWHNAFKRWERKFINKLAVFLVSAQWCNQEFHKECGQ